VLYEHTKRASTFFGGMLESLTFFGVSMEYVGVSNRLFDHFVLISFLSYVGIPIHFAVTLEITC
jgi:hypothetical protein